jgi:hypothetical protein
MYICIYIHMYIYNIQWAFFLFPWQYCWITHVSTGNTWPLLSESKNPWCRGYLHIGEGDWLYFERSAERYHDMLSNYIKLGTCLLLGIQNHIRLANYKHRSAMECWWMGFENSHPNRQPGHLLWEDLEPCNWDLQHLGWDSLGKRLSLYGQFLFCF